MFRMSKGKGGTKPILDRHAEHARAELQRYVDSLGGGQSEAEKTLGVKQATISRYLSGHNQVGIACLVALRRELRTPIDDLLALEPLDFRSDEETRPIRSRTTVGPGSKRPTPLHIVHKRT